MRILLIAAATLAVTASIGVGPSEAQSRGPKPWCISNGAFGPGTLDCTYWTLNQCRASASGAGGWCVENPEILWARRGQASQRPGQYRNDPGRY